MRISVLRWTDFHQNPKDPMREIQLFPNLGHNLRENEKPTLHNYIWSLRSNYRFIKLAAKTVDDEIYPFILGIFITDGSLQVSKKL